MRNHTLLISRLPNGHPEIFASLQGEGHSCGRPSVFLRLAFCNLSCAWCDTRYTWDWQIYDQQQEVMEMSLAEVEQALGTLEGDNLVVTGGEPLLQQQALAVLLRRQKAKGFRVEIETNGTIAPEHNLEGIVDQWNVSPKLSNCEEPERRRLVDNVLRVFRENPKAYFKFVIQCGDDLNEVEMLVRRLRLPRSRSYLMPEAADAKTLEKRSKWLVEHCNKMGFSFSPRLHIEMWDGMRGR